VQRFRYIKRKCLESAVGSSTAAIGEKGYAGRIEARRYRRLGYSFGINVGAEEKELELVWATVVKLILILKVNVK